MKLMKKKIWILIFTLIISIYPFGSIRAGADIIFESSSTQPLTSGVILENIVRFTVDGWINIRVLRVDLSNPYIKVDTLSNADSIRNLESTKSLAQSRNAVAAINGGFFDWSEQPGIINPIGPMVESGDIKTASSGFNKYTQALATFSINNLNQVFYSYWQTDITLVSSSGKSIPAARYNKTYNGSSDYTILDRKWSQYSVGVSDNYNDIMEVVVDNAEISEIREGKPAVEIPLNGYVVITRGEGKQLIKNNFRVGDTLEMDISTSTDWKNLEMAVTGGCVLVDKGKIPETFSHNISGRHPRTGIATSKDGRQIIMVTVDGRQQSSIGMTLEEFAQLMIELGAFNAINMDGGGSTTMVARELGTDNLKEVNKPSDGVARRVANAVGIISIAPPSTLNGFIIDTDDTNIFVNTSRQFTVRGYDRYFNPIYVDPGKIQWSVVGLKGRFAGNTFYPESVGEGRIIARVGDVKTELSISSLSSPVQLVLSEKSINLPVNSTKSFMLWGKNKNGYSAKIDVQDAKWAIQGNVGTFIEDTFTSTSEGRGYIEVSVGNTKAYCGVFINSDAVVITDNFEKDNGTFLSYPSHVPGSYEISSQQKHSGKYSGKLTYDFNDTEDSRAAYMVFNDDGILLSKRTQKIGIWVYNNITNPNWLRAMVYDADGQRHFVDFAQKMDWTGWKYVEASLEGIDSPSRLARIYLVQIHPVPDAGSIYFDDLTLISSINTDDDAFKIPEDTVPLDDKNKAIVYKETEDSFRFSVLGQSQQPGNALENLILIRFAQKINKYIDSAAFVGKGTHEIAQSIQKPYIATGDGYRSFDIKNSRFIQLDTGKNGIRDAHPAQWYWFLNEMESFDGDNIFVFIDSLPDTFSDSLEASLFKETLTQYKKEKYKNIWVFCRGDQNKSYMERGIKYIASCGLDADGLAPDSLQPAKYILVTVKGNDLTYQIKPIID